LFVLYISDLLSYIIMRHKITSNNLLFIVVYDMHMAIKQYNYHPQPHNIPEEARKA
jgi:hypothetical protein